MNYGQKQLSSSISGNNFFFELKPVKAWRAILAMAVAIAISLLIGGSVAIITFPLASLAVGWFLYRRYPLFYTSFTWWMWFVGPLIRRLIDFRCGYLTPGPWILTPLLVTAISILTLLKHLPKAHKQGGTPFVIAAASCLYGYLISLVNQASDIDKGIMLLLGWLVPIAFGFHLFIHWRDYPSYRQNLQRTFLWGVLFMGFYGIVQYVLAPPWDCFWLEEIAKGGTTSFGVPEPFGIRVSSSLDSPQSFAAIIVAGLILLFCIRGTQQLLATGLGYLSFLLSLARSGWLSWLFGVLVFFGTLKSNLKIRMLIAIIMTVLILLPVTTLEPFSAVIGDRIQSLTDTDSDVSLKGRREAFNLLFGYALVEFVGVGLQNPIEPNVEVSKEYVITDNGLLVLLFTLGWVGTLPYLLSLTLLIFQIRQACLKSHDLVSHASYGIIWGLLSQILFKSLTSGSLAVVFWGFIGIGMSARNYQLSQINSQNVSQREFRKLQNESKKLRSG
ncbi:MAG: O-antigen ligase domain-containing protein [Pleurocapsa sp. MO_226.B13]|nr:O-antigen ligase domain-containing protein [Pleurocapsa sp. MO_226.B13]